MTMVRGKSCPNSDQFIPKSEDEKTPRVVLAYKIGYRKRQSAANDNTSRFVGIPASSLLQDEPPSLVTQTRPCAARPLVWMKSRLGWAGSITIFTVTLAGPSGNPWSRSSQLLPPSKVAKKRPSSVAA